MLNLVILGGGKGKRLKKYFDSSKILLKIFNKTLLQLNLEFFNKIKKRYLIINQNQIDIKKYLKIKKFSNLKIFEEEKRLDTGGCLYYLKSIKNYEKKNFLIVYGDLITNIDYVKFYKFFKVTKSKISLLAHRNDHIMDSDTVDVNENDFVDRFYFKPHKNIKDISTLTMSGISIINGSVLKNLTKKKISFNLLLKKNRKKTSVFETRDFVKDVGTPKRVRWVKKNLNFSKLIRKKNIPNKAIFLDRDGVINLEKKNEKVSNPFNFAKGIFNALRVIKKNNYLIIIITNQPGVAKGFISENKLKNINKKYINFFSRKKIIIDSLLYCPHHPEKGFKGEIKKFKVNCNCRKPKIGLFINATKKFNIDIKNSLFVGNSQNDFYASKKMKLKYFHIYNKNKVDYVHKNLQFKSLNKVINNYFKN